MKKKTAVITGAYRGLGLETARQLLKKGCDVVITSRKRPEGERAAEVLCKESGKPVHFVMMDVEDNNSIQNAVKEIAKKFDHLDILINNAGIYPDGNLSPLEVHREQLLHTFNVNAASALEVTNAFITLLENSSLARVVNISSGLGSLSEMQGVAPTYSISKAALNAVTRQLAAALKDKNILVNSVCPGWVRTEMGGTNAPRSPEEGAAGIVWAAMQSDETGGFYRDGKLINW